MQYLWKGEPTGFCACTIYVKTCFFLLVTSCYAKLNGYIEFTFVSFLFLPIISWLGVIISGGVIHHCRIESGCWWPMNEDVVTEHDGVNIYKSMECFRYIERTLKGYLTHKHSLFLVSFLFRLAIITPLAIQPLNKIKREKKHTFYLVGCLCVASLSSYSNIP
jgi:hypothetical protein